MTCCGRTAVAMTTSTPPQIPPDARHPVAGEGEGILPGDPGPRAGGLPYPAFSGARGRPVNGVLTAIEDFVGAVERIRLAVVPAFFGFAVAWDTGPRGPTTSQRSSTRSTATRCSSGSRPTASSTWHAATRSDRGLGARRPAVAPAGGARAAAGLECVRHRRAAVAPACQARASRATSRSSRRTRSGGRSASNHSPSPETWRIT